MNAGRILALILAVAMPAYGASNYDRTIDGKTKIWHNSSEQGLQATWTGERDENGYATGRGTLTWFRVRHDWETGSRLPGSKYTQVTQYTGKMVDGKLDGQVVIVDAKGKTFHTKFADGEKSGEWIAGAPTKQKASDDSTTTKVAVVKPRPSPPTVPPTTVTATEEPPPPAEAPPPPPKLDQHVASQPPPKVVDQPAQPSPATEQSPASAEKSDSSLRSLAMPPSSLRVASLNEPSHAPAPATPDAEETVVSSGSAASQNAASPKDDDARMVAALDSEYHAAVKTNDASTMDRILADDFVFVSGGGPKLSKQDVLNKARTNQVKYERHEVEEGSQNVRVWKDTAVVTETVWVKGSENGSPVDQKMSVTETYARTPDGWRYVSGQATAPSH